MDTRETNYGGNFSKLTVPLKGMEGEDIAQVNLLYPDGSIGNIIQSWTSNWGDEINEVKIMGDKGSILITDALYYNSEKLSTDVEYGDSFSNQAKAFTDSILYGKKPLSSLKDVENALKIINGAYESSEDGSVKTFQV